MYCLRCRGLCISCMYVTHVNNHNLPCTHIQPPLYTHTTPPPTPHTHIQKRKELSAITEGPIILVEYLEENPLLLSQTGMGLRLTTFYRKTSNNDTNHHQLRNERNPWQVGAIHALSGEDDSPLLGNIKRGRGGGGGIYMGWGRVFVCCWCVCGEGGGGKVYMGCVIAHVQPVWGLYIYLYTHTCIHTYNDGALHARGVLNAHGTHIIWYTHRHSCVDC